MNVREFKKSDAEQASVIWNSVVENGEAFPQTECLDITMAINFFEAQTYSGVAESEINEIVGVYILHPNNVGRCGHICNASYAVKSNMRGKHIGEALVTDCMNVAKALGFRILQFNAVVADNTAALSLYRKLGFVQLGVIPEGFLSKDGTYKDIIPHYHTL